VNGASKFEFSEKSVSITMRRKIQIITTINEFLMFTVATVISGDNNDNTPVGLVS